MHGAVHAAYMQRRHHTCQESCMYLCRQGIRSRTGAAHTWHAGRLWMYQEHTCTQGICACVFWGHKYSRWKELWMQRVAHERGLCTKKDLHVRGSPAERCPSPREMNRTGAGWKKPWNGGREVRGRRKAGFALTKPLITPRAIPPPLQHLPLSRPPERRSGETKPSQAGEAEGEGGSGLEGGPLGVAGALFPPPALSPTASTARLSSLCASPRPHRRTMKAFLLAVLAAVLCVERGKRATPGYHHIFPRSSKLFPALGSN